MSRRFTFRVWDKTDNKMYDLDSLYVTLECAGHIALECSDNGEHFLPQDLKGKEWIIMQCTGLEDVNGFEIYEGDIVKSGGSNWLVEYSWNGFFIKDCNMDSSADILGDCTVIGNIYENPEVLEVKI